LASVIEWLLLVRHLDIVAEQSSSPDRYDLWQLYKIVAADLSYLRTQQWSVTNYALLLFAGVIGIADLLRPDLVTSDRCVLVIVTLVVAGIALFVLRIVQGSMREQHRSLRSLRAEIARQFPTRWLPDDKDEERFHGVYLLQLAVVASAAIVCGLVTWRFCGA